MVSPATAIVFFTFQWSNGTTSDLLSVEDEDCGRLYHSKIVITLENQKEFKHLEKYGLFIGSQKRIIID